MGFNRPDMMGFSEMQPVAAYAVLFMGLAVAVARDWRLVLPALLGLYGFVFAWQAGVVPLPLAFTTLLVGLFVTLIFYVTLRQGGMRGSTAVSRWIALGVAVLVALASWGMSGSLEQMMMLGLLGLGCVRFFTTTSPAHVGLGVLMLLLGMGLLALDVFSPVWAWGAFGVGHLATAVVVAYLSQWRLTIITE